MSAVPVHATPLTPAETSELDILEEVIARGVHQFVAVGNALLRIRDGRLYRSSHATFAEYLADRWDMKRPRGYELMEAAATVTAVSEISDTPPVTNEAQAAALAPIVREHGPEVAAQVLVQTAEQGAPTAAAIRQTAEDLGVRPKRLRGRRRPDPPGRRPPPPHRRRMEDQVPGMTEEFWQQCVAKHAELVDKHHGEHLNRKLIRDEWERWVTANMPTESVEKLKAAQRENLWQKIERATKANNSYIEPLTEGQLLIFDIPDVLGLPIVAGKHRRVLIGRQTKDDAHAILEEAESNAAHVNGDCCYLCGQPPDTDDPLQIEHVKPLAAGGSHELANLRLAHRSCNQSKGTRAVAAS